MSNGSQQLEELKLLNVRLRQQLEQAELMIPALNDQIERLAGIGLAYGIALYGDSVLDQSNLDGTDASVVHQAVLLVPGGLGLAVWDREDFLAHRAPDEPGFDEAHPSFKSCAELTPAELALLLPQSKPLLDRLLLMVETIPR